MEQSEAVIDQHDAKEASFVEQLLRGDVVPKNRLENQIRLAAQLYVREHATEELDFTSHDIRNDIMLSWSEGGASSLSKAYHDLEQDSNFLVHPRLQGDILRITVDDVLYYRDNHVLAA